MLRTENIKPVMIALLKAGREFGAIVKDRTNPAFRSKYADLGAVYDAVVPALAKHGLVVSHPTRLDGTTLVVETLLIHAESGEFWGSEYPAVPTKPDPQGMGSAVTYAKRYGLCSLLGVTPDDDDDGNAASRREAPQRHHEPPPPAPEPPTRDVFGEWVRAESKRMEIAAEQIVHHLGKTLCPDVPAVLKARGNALREIYSTDEGRLKLRSELTRYAIKLTPAGVANDSDPDMP